MEIPVNMLATFIKYGECDMLLKLLSRQKMTNQDVANLFIILRPNAQYVKELFVQAFRQRLFATLNEHRDMITIGDIMMGIKLPHECSYLTFIHWQLTYEVDLMIWPLYRTFKMEQYHKLRQRGYPPNIAYKINAYRA